MNDYNATLLDGELKAAGLLIHGCASTGRIDWISPPSAADLATAQAVLMAHNPNKPTRLEQIRAKRKAGGKLTAEEQQEVLDLLMGM